MWSLAPWRFEPEVTGPLVDAGVVGSRAAGISHGILNANIERQTLERLVRGRGLSHSGERWADTANTFKTPAVTTVSLGARSRFVLAGRPAEFRRAGLEPHRRRRLLGRADRPLLADRAAHGAGHSASHSSKN